MDDCCAPSPVNDLDHHFGTERAQDDAADYLENGLIERGEKMLAYLDIQGISLNSVLDIGCGAGALHHELLLRNIAEKAIGLEASSAFLKAAKANALELGLDERTDYFSADFAQTPESAKMADAVLMDRVLCCYPDMLGLMQPATQKAKRFLIISYPRKAWLVRIFYWFRGWIKALQRSAFRLYYHEADEIRAAAVRGGMKLVDQAIDDRWQIDVYQRVAS